MALQTNMETDTWKSSLTAALLMMVFIFVIIAMPITSCVAKGGLREQATVIRVVDGDTIVVLLNGQEEYVRYIGINTPEMGEEGSQYAFQLNTYLVGDTVSLERDKSDRDQYGRLLRYVWNMDYDFVNCELLRAEAAEVAVYPPDTKRIPELTECVP